MSSLQRWILVVVLLLAATGLGLLLQVVSTLQGRKINPEEVRLDHYGFDPRNRWDTWAVILVDDGPVGFTNACLDPDFSPAQSQFSGLGAL